eukprot:Sspe_Gene.3550::Locus_1178_Transcript_1_1_Confidence_1.000_Length_2517::g.3550::m.3550/K11259/ILVBL; acetolactate synthase-like protein
MDGFPRVSGKVLLGAAVLSGACTTGYLLRMCRLGSIEYNNRNGGELVAKVLKSHGVKFVFTLIGGHVSPIIVASEEEGIRVVDVRHEATAVFAADAVSRLSGIPGVAVVTAGPGVTNTLTAVKNAQMAQSPVVVIGGAAATVLKGRGSLQDIDQLSLFRSVVKYSVTITRIKDIPSTMRKAFQEAVSGVPGPVFVEIPIDLLYPVLELKANMGLCTRKLKKDITEADHPHIQIPTDHPVQDVTEYVASLQAKHPVFLTTRKKQPAVVEWYLDYQLRRIFGDAWKDTAFTPLPVHIPTPRAGDVRRVSKLLAEAKRPVVILGSQVTVNGPDLTNEVADTLSSLGVPVFLSGMARGIMGRSHPHFFRQNRKVALNDADLIVLFGVMVDFRLDYGRALGKKATVVAVNRSKEDLTRNTDMFWKPKIAALADPAMFIAELGKGWKAGAPRPSCDQEWVKKLQEKQSAKEESNKQLGGLKAYGHGRYEGKELVNPLAVLHSLDEKLKGNKKVIFIGDGGDFVATAAYTLRPPAPLTWMDPGPFGTLGVGGGFALGAALCCPDHQVWLLWGDGSAGYSVAEYDTFQRHNLPVISLVGNDGCWTQIVRDQRVILGSEAACNLEYCDYAAIAQHYMMSPTPCITITEPKQIESGLDEGLAQQKKGQPVLINCIIGATDFREGSMSV